ncbi:hypothetical protein RA11412_1265 [Rothia aeria]|uniref:Uncharacterized protein n=1 Tax=Rothia aeria TaxID=172042 RepID=A0A2Z5QZB4_9MICC|nr:hypothetical protein RA11412_1265 [Rothia aeria]
MSCCKNYRVCAVRTVTSRFTVRTVSCVRFFAQFLWGGCIL